MIHFRSKIIVMVAFLAIYLFLKLGQLQHSLTIWQTMPAESRFSAIVSDKSLKIPKSAVTADVALSGPIPHALWFTYKHNILTNKTPQIFYKNIVKSIDSYRNAWKNDPNMTVKFLVDSNCTDLLKEVDQELNLSLSNSFLAVTSGAFKSDLCRLAVLYLHGGYYFDIDMEVIQPILLGDEISFSSATSTIRPVFFQSYLASTPRHPIIRRNLDTMEEYYRGEGQCIKRKTRVVGCCTLMTAWKQTQKKGNVKILQEVLLNHEMYDGAYSNIPFRGQMKACHFIVHDPQLRQVYFYSRIQGSHRCP